MTLEHLDVVVVGGGLSGIGVARHLLAERPGTTLAVLEARDALGGTWDLFRYPGVRSDSDLPSYGFDFEPWTDPRTVAEGGSILAYLRRTAADHGVEPHVRLRHRVVSASWSSATARWTLDVERDGPTGAAPLRLTCRWLFCAGGYFRYDRGWTPDIPGLHRFAGPVVHPQLWPADLDHAGRRVVVIGSGATAVSLVPALAETAGHVTMLQRTPSYVLPRGSRDVLAGALGRLLGPRRALPLVRRKNLALTGGFWWFCRRFPRAARRLLLLAARARLPRGYPVHEHFSPPYDPWDERLCVAPDGDLFSVVRSGRVEVVTDRIESVTTTGVRLVSGRHLDADVLVTATGLDVQPMGGMRLTVDGAPVDPAATVTYLGMMLSGVPNFAYAVGYTVQSWTLKVGLVARHLDRVLEHMAHEGVDVCTPEAPAGMATRPVLELTSGWALRAAECFPKQGDRAPWVAAPAFSVDPLRRTDGLEPSLRFSRAGSRTAPVDAASAAVAARAGSAGRHEDGVT